MTSRQKQWLFFGYGVAIIVGSAFTFFWTRDARADIGLVEACLAGDGFAFNGPEDPPPCPSGERAWVRPAPGDHVLSCGSVATDAECTWNHAEFIYREWSLVPDSMLVMTCALDVPIGAFIDGDPCGSAHTDKPRIPKALVIPASVSSGSCEITLEWLPPIENTDGTPLTDLAAYRIKWGLSSGEYVNSRLLEDPGLTSYALQGLPDDEEIFIVMTALNDAGLESDDSGELPHECPAVPIIPSPPSSLSVRADESLVFDFVPQTNRAVMLPVGTIPAGTPCRADEAVIAAGVAYYGVPRELVTWAGDVEPDVVYTRCQ